MLNNNRQVYLKPKNDNDYLSVMLCNNNFNTIKKDECIYTQWVFSARNSLDISVLKIKSKTFNYIYIYILFWRDII